MRLIVTAMKNEGAFILEWAAYHLSIGVDRFLVYTNDCEDGSDAIWERLAALGYGAHERNDDIRARGVQKTALMKADDHPLVAEAEWLGCLDVDEFINVKHGAGTLDDLFAALPEADMIMLFLSSSAWASASAFILSISPSDGPPELVMSILFDLPVALSVAVTFRMPLASMANSTSI